MYRTTSQQRSAGKERLLESDDKKLNTFFFFFSHDAETLAATETNSSSQLSVSRTKKTYLCRMLCVCVCVSVCVCVTEARLQVSVCVLPGWSRARGCHTGSMAGSCCRGARLEQRPGCQTCGSFHASSLLWLFAFHQITTTQGDVL